MIDVGLVATNPPSAAGKICPVAVTLPTFIEPLPPVPATRATSPAPPPDADAEVTVTLPGEVRTIAPAFPLLPALAATFPTFTGVVLVPVMRMGPAPPVPRLLVAKSPRAIGTLFAIVMAMGEVGLELEPSTSIDEPGASVSCTLPAGGTALL